ncbi:hypothetical protein TRICI_004694 [Trichomonascus ciferrii]|uniref:F-box domain-containing protein n=1 Tax=Trichomonascus ciferrii TaxID=44093 RepID=A0A642V082_9ASCO|nr:hypothetical protein TRICI_004694 [Trichomonascus ciferrii]
MRFAFYNHSKTPNLKHKDFKCYCYFNKAHYTRKESFEEPDFVQGKSALFPWVSTTTEIQIHGNCLKNDNFIVVFYKVLVLIEYWKVNGFEIKFLHPVNADKEVWRQMIQRLNDSTSWFKVYMHTYQSTSHQLVFGPKFAHITYEPHYNADSGNPPCWPFWFSKKGLTFSNLTSVTIGGSSSFDAEIDLHSVPFFFQLSGVELKKLAFVYLNLVVNSLTSEWRMVRIKELHFIGCTVTPKANLLLMCNPCFVSEKLVINGQGLNILKVFDFPCLKYLEISNQKLARNPFPTDFSLPNLQQLYCPIDPADGTPFLESLLKFRKLEVLVLYFCRASEKSTQRLRGEVISNTPTLKSLTLIGDNAAKTYINPSWQEEHDPIDSLLATS